MGKVLVGFMFGALLAAGVVRAQNAPMFTMKELCEQPEAHKYCEEGGGCSLYSAQAMMVWKQKYAMAVREAYAEGVAAGKRMAQGLDQAKEDPSK